MPNLNNGESQKTEGFRAIPSLWLMPFGPDQVAGIRSVVPAGTDERLLRFIARAVPAK